MDIKAHNSFEDWARGSDIDTPLSLVAEAMRDAMRQAYEAGWMAAQKESGRCTHDLHVGLYESDGRRAMMLLSITADTPVVSYELGEHRIQRLSRVVLARTPQVAIGESEWAKKPDKTGP